MQPCDQFIPQLTADGSYTFFSTEFGETFHVPYGAIEETNCKFIAPTQLTSKAQQPELHLLDICYGLGYNSAAAWVSRILGRKRSVLYKIKAQERLKILIWLDYKLALSPQVRKSRFLPESHNVEA